MRCHMCKQPTKSKSRRCLPCDAAYHRERRAAGREQDNRKNHRTGEGDQTCTCSAYKYPHRKFSGRCSLYRWVKSFFENIQPECSNCINRDGIECEVVAMTEEPWHCPALRDHVRSEEIRLYGRPAEQRNRSEQRTK